MSITANKWTTIEPSVIRDAISGRLGYQNKFGTTYVSGATSALSLKQNPLDGSENQGDATLYIGTTNGGVYMRHYDYQSDTWSDQWTWLSEPSGTSDGGYDGAQGIGALAISPDGNFIAVGRGNSSNYAAYTPSGPALQIGRILPDGSVDWLPVSPDMFLSGDTQSGNIRDLSWQDDALYGSCQQRWPFFHAACFKLINSLTCSFGGFSQTSLMGFQLRVARLFQRLGMARLACSYT
jgi:hypothetical protein